MISPSLAGYLLTQYSQVSRGERRPLRPLLDTREQEILRLLVDGRTDREIGGALFISARTVQNCLMKIRDKTGLTRRAELARWAVEHALA